MTGLSLFPIRAVSDEGPAARRAETSHWPASFSPKTADAFAHNQVIIRAKPSTVWHYLVSAEQWTSWDPRVKDVKMLTPERTLGPHSKFLTTRFGSRWESTVDQYVPNERIASTSVSTDGTMRSYRSWLLTPTADRCRVVLEVAGYGPVVAEYAVQANQGYRDQLKRLKAVCEAHPAL